MSRKIVIAIDGYSSSGKSTMARELAREIGYTYVDSGAMYRAVALYALRHGMADAPRHALLTESLLPCLSDIKIAFSKPEGAEGRQRTLLNGEDVEDQIRGMEVSEVVSLVAAVPEIRHYLVELQQAYGREKGIVMDGRDIGTTVFPDAEMKVFVDASAEERARRRTKELMEKGREVSYDEVLENIRRRDHIDSTRSESPLRKADDAVVLDNDRMTCAEQLQWLRNLYVERSGDTEAAS